MSTRKVLGRQFVDVAVADLGIADMGNTVTVQIPPGGILKGLVALTITAFDSVTTAVLTVSDGTTTFVNAVDLKSTGSETVANVPKFYPNGGVLTISPSQTGTAATVGRCVVYADIIGVNRVNEGQ